MFVCCSLRSASMRINIRCRRKTHTDVKESFNVCQTPKSFFRKRNPLPASGLFLDERLTSPEGFHHAKEEAIRRSWQLLEEATTAPPGVETITKFDELSDTLCKVADLSDFIRSSHPDPGFQQAATEAYLSIGTLVEELNTNQKLFRALETVTKDPEISLDEETRIVAHLFLDDFKISGIHLEQQQRHQAVELHQQLLQIISTFLQNAHNPVLIPSTYVPDHIRHCFAPHDDHHVVVSGLLSDNPNEEVREFAYKVFHHNHLPTEQLLSNLFATRHQLAQLLGYRSYSERTLTSMTVSNPNDVIDFLQVLSKQLKPHAEAELKQLEMMKETDRIKQRCLSSYIRAWDVPLYCARMRSQGVDLSQFSSFFSLGHCMSGLCHLFRSLYGVALVPTPTCPGETWCDDVIKLTVQDARSGDVIGAIYCDFFARANKTQQDCHFTIRGGRQLRDGSYQTPMVVLVLNLQKPLSNQPPLLSTVTMGNLFHEMGHAMHSMLASTRYQHVTGTRCATDFAEVPSILMEYFANDPRVLTSFARHYQTGETLNEEMLKSLKQSNRIASAFETQTQVYYSIMDQSFHTGYDGTETTHQVLQKIEQEHALVPAVEHGSWHHRFGHFAAYGAKYHAYLVSKAVASRIWTRCFQNNPFDREMGERYKREMLRHGGGKHPILMYEAMLEEKFNLQNLAYTLIDDLTDI